MKWNNRSISGINYSIFFLENWPWPFSDVLSVNCGPVAMPAATDDIKINQVRPKHLGSDARLPRFKYWFCL